MVAALERGYRVLMLDGPGQGEMLYKRGCQCARIGRW